MISVIGTRNTITGLGLCGLEDLHEVESHVTPKEIKDIIDKADSDTIVIEEHLARQITLPKHKEIILIPEKEVKTDVIDVLVARSLGISENQK